MANDDTTTTPDVGVDAVSDVEEFRRTWAAGEQYLRDVNAEFERLGGDVDSPQWTDWCAEMDEWTAALAPEVTID